MIVAGSPVYLSEIQAFLNSKIRNKWMQFNTLEIYVRRTIRFEEPYIDIAFITVYQQRQKHLLNYYQK